MDAEPEAFQLVLSYIYTDRIHPAKLNGTTITGGDGCCIVVGGCVVI